MPLARPPRPPAGAITERVRRAIIVAGSRFDMPADVLVWYHAQAEHIGGWVDLIGDVEERYRLAPNSLLKRVNDRRQNARRMAGAVSPTTEQVIDAECVLHALPDTEFLTAIQNSVSVGYEEQRLSAVAVANILTAADGALRAHGCPFRYNQDDLSFVWVGDAKQHELTVQPALQALADPRLAGARAEFEDALLKRRAGTPKALEDAVDEAAKSVESTLKILHHEHNIPLPNKNNGLGALFGRLSSNDSGRKALLPGWLEHLVLAAGGPRNNMSSHGQGPTIRVVPEELADASIAAAATAITLLAHYLP